MSVLQELPRKLRARIKARHVPGASVAVLRGRTPATARIVATAAAGVVNLDTNVPVTTDSVFQIGSITKPFTTTLVMQLVDEGLVTLDCPVVDYLPTFRVADLHVSRKVTARHLLSHQSGIDGDLFVDAGRGDDNVQRLVDKATMVPSLFPIGTKHSYCNLGFAVLGRVCEVVTGKTYDTLLRERIFEPLGMDHALSLPEDMMRFSCAIGHVPVPGKKDAWQPTRVPYLSLGHKSAGSTPAMSAVDLSKFAQMHMNRGRGPDGAKVLSARSVSSMLRRQIKLQRHTPRNITHWGLGWFLMDWNGARVHGHDGGTVGQFAFLRILPAKNLAVVMLTNGGDATGLYQDVFGFLFEGLVRTAVPDVPEPVSGLKVNLSRYEGTYANINVRHQFSVNRGRLRVTTLENGSSAPFVGPTDVAFVDRTTARLQTNNPILDRTLFLFSDLREDKMQYVASGMRQFRRID